MTSPVNNKHPLGAVLCMALLTLASGTALAQRALTNTNSGGDPPPPTRIVNTLTQCDVNNTRRLNTGAADACLGQVQRAENTADVQGLAATYSAGLAYTLSMSLAVPDRQSVGGPSVSSGGLLAATGLGTGSLFIKFQRQEVGSYVFAFSGTYDDAATGNAFEQWSGYYLYDFVQSTVDVLSGMPFQPFQSSSFITFPVFGGDPVFNPRHDYTRGLVVNQVSVYQLDRTPSSGTGQVAEPATWLLSGLALLALGLASQRRKLKV